jgi:hypothetical protein
MTINRDETGEGNAFMKSLQNLYVRNGRLTIHAYELTCAAGLFAALLALNISTASSVHIDVAVPASQCLND